MKPHADPHQLDSALKLICLASFRSPNQRFVFMLPTYERARVTAIEFNSLIESIPEWARVKVRLKRVDGTEFDNGCSVKFVHSPIQLKGITMDALFVAGDCKEDDIEYVAPVLLMAV